MSFVFNGLSSIGIVSRTKTNTPSVTQSQVTQASSIHHISEVNQDDISSIDENDIVSDEDDIEDNDYGDDNSDSFRNENVETDEDGIIYDNVSTITNVTKKKLDADIQLEVWNIGLEQLDSYNCPCKGECTQNVPVGHVVHTRRSLYGQGNVTSLIRRKAIFGLLNRANISASNEFRYINLEYNAIVYAISYNNFMRF